MKKELNNLLLGFGFSRLSERRRRLLGMLLLISLAVHAFGLAVFGGWVVMRARLEEKTVFVAPPPIKTYEPRKLEHRVKVQKKQRSSSRPSMVPRMVAMKPSTLAFPEIKVDPKIIHTSFQPKFKAVSGTGLGAGLGTGYGVGGFGSGVSQFNFFGIRGRGDRIAILVDVSVSMVEDERGGPEGFQRVKDRINDVIDALHEAAFFNVVVFADAASTWKSELLIASDSNKTDAKRFLAPYNKGGNWGLSTGNVYASGYGLQAWGGTTRLDLALTAAFEQNADTILIISDGLPRVERGVSDQAQSEYNRRRDEWNRKNAGALREWAANAKYEERKVWVGGNEGGLKEGRAANTGPGHWEVRRVRVGGGRRPTPPPPPPKQFWTLADFVRHLQILHEKLYEAKGKKLPVIHCIGYQIDKEGGAFLRDLTRHYKGRYRRVARIR